jgi:hypothetical protein
MKNAPKPHLLTPVMEERVILVAYGEGSFLDKIIVHSTRKHNRRVALCYESHVQTITRIRNEMHSIHCPNALEERLLLFDVNTAQLPPVWSSILNWSGRIVVPGIAAVLLVVSILSTQLNQGPTQEEIEAQLAAEQALASFAMIADIMERANQTVAEEGLARRTAQPIQRSLYQGM